MGVKTEEFQLNEPTWKPNLDELAEKVTAKTRIIFIDNPNNPTGALLTEKEMRSICEIAEDVGAYVHCDNALRGSELTGKPAETPLPYYEKAIVTGSISKLGATSPRIGWIIAEEEVIKECWTTKYGVEKQPYLKNNPGLSEGAAHLLAERGVKLVGGDTPTIDSDANPTEPAHRVLLPKHILVLENAKNLGELPPKGAYFIGLPLRIKDGTGCPVRAIALVPR
jgi:hypothetical protein